MPSPRVPLPLLAAAVLAILVLVALESAPPQAAAPIPAPRPASCPDFWVTTPDDRARPAALEGRTRQADPTPERIVEPRPAARIPEAPLGTRRSCPPGGPDPWVRNERPRIKPPARPRHYGPLPSARPSPTGHLAISMLEWWDAPTGDGFELAAYDVALLAPLTGASLPALRGLAPERWFSAEAADPWWQSLAKRLIDAVGHARWADPALLAWDAHRSTLYVRQDADGHARIAEALVRHAAGRLGSIRIDVVLEGEDGTPPLTLTVDVPWGSAVRAHRGTSFAYLGDYEIACGMGGSYIDGPHVLTVDTGFGVSARRVVESDGTETLDLEVAAASKHPEIERRLFSSSLRDRDLPLEIASIDAASWRGRISARCGRSAVHLDDGRRATLVVHEERCAKAADPPFERRVLLPRAEPRRVPPPPASSLARVAWAPPRANVESMIEAPLRAGWDSPRGLRSEGRVTVDARGRIVKPEKLECPWPLAEGGAIIGLSVHEAGGMDVVDLVLERCGEAIETRTTPCHHQTGYDSAPRRSWVEPLTLHACPMRVDSRRIHVPHGETVTVHLDDAPGGTLRISVPRDE